jgi:hypothetical protein
VGEQLKTPLRLLANGAVLDADGKLAFRIVYAENAQAIVDAVESFEALAALRSHPHLRYVLKDLECSGEGRGYTECVALVTKLLRGCSNG